MNAFKDARRVITFPVSLVSMLSPPSVGVSTAGISSTPAPVFFMVHLLNYMSNPRQPHQRRPPRIEDTGTVKSFSPDSSGRL
jgi:hypothetical protein